jgi:N-acetylglutamate synthase
VTRRANSVLAARMGARHTLDERIELAEQFYRRYGLPARYQLCPASQPPELDAALVARGYTISTPNNVQVAQLAQTAALASGRAQISERFDEAWLAAYVASEGETSPAKIAARREMLQRIGPPTGFVALEQDGMIVASALGVVERGWLGIFNVATHPAYRRRGLGLLALGDLAAWAQERGAERAYLQVMSSNTPALTLYNRLGFTTRYTYWYREMGGG